jgi:protein O-mannosyl-transferase
MLASTPPAPPHGFQRWNASAFPWSALLLLLAVILLAYWPGRNGGFVFDDYQNIVENPALHAKFDHWRHWLVAALSSPASALQRPLAMLSFAANAYFSGLAPAPMKLTNVGIHLVNVVLVFGLARTLLNAAAKTSQDWLAIFVAAAWGLHPINLTAVLYIVQRMESLSHVFVYAGLWMYASGRFRQRSGGDGWRLVLGGILGGSILGILCKESALLLPLYAFGLEVFLFRFETAGEKRSRAVIALHVAILLAPTLAAIAWQLPQVLEGRGYAGREFTLLDRLLTEPRVVLGYLRWILLPDLRQFGLYHDDIVVSHALMDPPATLAALLGIPLLGLGAWLLHHRAPLLALGTFWFLAAQLLTATVIPLELVFEHRNYFASFAVCLALAALLHIAAATEWRRVAVTLGSAFVLACGVTTGVRSIEWNSPTRFAASEAIKHPNSPRATYEYARALIIAGNYDPHWPGNGELARALVHAQHAPGSGALPDHAALMFSARTGIAPAPGTWERLQQTLRNRPVGAQEQLALAGLTNCAAKGLCKFPSEQMLATYAAALAQGPNAGVLALFGKYALYVLRDPPLALRLWQDAVAASPRTAQYRVNLAALLIDMGRDDEARIEIRELRSLGRFRQHAQIADMLQQRLSAPPGSASTQTLR